MIKLAAILILLICLNAQNKKYAIAIHGGAGTISKEMPDSISAKYNQGLKIALDIGTDILKKGGTSLEAVQAVIVNLENNPLFNAGKGAVYTADGTHELDASIMDGSTYACGAITGVTTVKNPILLAYKVMTQSKHVLFAGSGAEKFADEMSVERVKNSYFDTKTRFEQWNKSKKGTVGCVALDMSGNLAAGTSTGGMTNKKFGRVGDTPIIGAGTYADNLTCAISATGSGEEFIRFGVAKTISDIMKYGNKSLKEAGETVIFKILKADDGGIISVDKEGNISMPFNSLGMYRAAANSQGFETVKIWE
jgi:beta-aspartyl-peptidase (threonine type)